MIKNLQQALVPLADLQKGLAQAKSRAELIVANLIAEQARANAPGSLGSKIDVLQNESSTVINAGDELSAYVEFGTGIEATKFLAGKPEEQVAEAAKFFVNGEGRLNPHPFFFPAIYEHRDELIPEIDNELQKLAN